MQVNARHAAISIALALSILAAVEACTALPEPAKSPSISTPVIARPTPKPLVALIAGDWELSAATVDGRSVQLLPDYPISLLIDGSRSTGTSACNRYGAEIAVVDGRLKFGPFSSTLMGCQADVDRLERTYGQALGRVDSARLDGPVLVLSGTGVELRFGALAPPPFGLFVDREWVLHRLIVNRAELALGGDAATLVIGSDGTLGGSTGCRTFDGTYIIEGDQLTATTLSGGDSTACTGAVLEQDGTILTVFDGFTARLEGSELNLNGSGISSQYRQR